MQMSLAQSELVEYTAAQLGNLFPDGRLDKEVIAGSIETALQRTEHCFSRVNNKYFRTGANVLFNYLNGDQYAMYLYFLNNSVYKKTGDGELSSKLYLLNKYLHGVDVFYEVDLPDIFLFTHPLGSVLGRAKYSDYFHVYQHCNVGSNNGAYPVLAEHLTMHPGSSILGECRVGRNSKIAAGALLLDMWLEQDSLYVGGPSNFRIHTRKELSQVWNMEGKR